MVASSRSACSTPSRTYPFFIVVVLFALLATHLSIVDALPVGSRAAAGHQNVTVKRATVPADVGSNFDPVAQMMEDVNAARAEDSSAGISGAGTSDLTIETAVAETSGVVSSPPDGAPILRSDAVPSSQAPGVTASTSAKASAASPQTTGAIDTAQLASMLSVALQASGGSAPAATATAASQAPIVVSSTFMTVVGMTLVPIAALAPPVVTPVSTAAFAASTVIAVVPGPQTLANKVAPAEAPSGVVPSTQTAVNPTQVISPTTSTDPLGMIAQALSALYIDGKHSATGAPTDTSIPTATVTAFPSSTVTTPSPPSASLVASETPSFASKSSSNAASSTSSLASSASSITSASPASTSSAPETSSASESAKQSAKSSLVTEAESSGGYVMTFGANTEKVGGATSASPTAKSTRAAASGKKSTASPTGAGAASTVTAKSSPTTQETSASPPTSSSEQSKSTQVDIEKPSAFPSHGNLASSLPADDSSAGEAAVFTVATTSDLSATTQIPATSPPPTSPLPTPSPDLAVPLPTVSLPSPPPSVKNVNVGSKFDPDHLDVYPGDTVSFVWAKSADPDAATHSVTRAADTSVSSDDESSSCLKSADGNSTSGNFDSGPKEGGSGAVWNFVVPNETRPGKIGFFSSVGTQCQDGMKGLLIVHAPGTRERQW